MRRDSTIPSVEFECSSVVKTETGVAVALVNGKLELEVPFDSVDDVAQVNGKTYITIFRRNLGPLALDYPLGPEEKQKAEAELQENRPVAAPLVFVDVVAKGVSIGD